jgi:hypothetical protein
MAIEKSDEKWLTILSPLFYCAHLPADRYLLPFVSTAPCIEILRLRLRMTAGQEGRRITLTSYSSPAGQYLPL